MTNDESLVDRNAIDSLASQFYRLFTNKDGVLPQVARIYELFIPEGLIVRAGDPPVVYHLATFVEPREKLLTDGTLVEFEEHEIDSRTWIVGNIAQRLSLYEKSGLLSGAPYSGRGIKMLHFVKMSGAWKMIAAAWDDEREGFVLDGELSWRSMPIANC